ncbi:hypothetical protein [Microbacterium hydrocarbonoxydans]|jgi:hypothetical protein|uniref:hypothetical protein n=1 Tax=Microbacterium hydrocarbonoxydans TaxID=273678 RepID=UPI003D99DABE
MSIDTGAFEATASTPESPEPTASVSPTPPRTRWAAIIWGAVFAAIAVSMIGLLADGRRRDDVAEWILSLTPASITAMALLALGGIVLVCGAIGLIRRVQRRAASA